jgi:Crp-like helix-turn-helix domain
LRLGRLILLGEVALDHAGRFPAEDLLVSLLGDQSRRWNAHQNPGFLRKLSVIDTWYALIRGPIRDLQHAGVRREGVTEAAQKLQQAGLISYVRGRITVLDRPGLEKRTCECYGVVKREYDRLLPEKLAT